MNSATINGNASYIGRLLSQFTARGAAVCDSDRRATRRHRDAVLEIRRQQTADRALRLLVDSGVGHWR